MRAGLRGCITWSTAGSCRKFLARKGLMSWLFPWGLWGASEEASAEDRPVSGRGLEHRTSHGQTASLRVCGPAGRGCLGAHWTGCWKTQRRSERGQGRWVFPGIRAPPLSDPEAQGSATVLGSLPRLVRSDRHPLPDCSGIRLPRFQARPAPRGLSHGADCFISLLAQRR